MLLNGEVQINAPRNRVWEFMTDPGQICQCAPGVESVEMVESLKRYLGVISVGFGAIKARFDGEVEILELLEPDYAKLKAHGKATGSVADVISEMNLSDGPDGSTVLHWTADVNVGGQLAGLASRLLVPVTQKLSNEFYDEVRRRIENEV